MNFLLAISTTVGMTIIPILVTDSLGLSMLILGLIEGTTEFISNMMEQRRPKYEAAADVVVNTDYKTVEEIAEEIVVKLTRDAD